MIQGFHKFEKFAIHIILILIIKFRESSQHSPPMSNLMSLLIQLFCECLREENISKQTES